MLIAHRAREDTEIITDTRCKTTRPAIVVQIHSIQQLTKRPSRIHHIYWRALPRLPCLRVSDVTCMCGGRTRPNACFSLFLIPFHTCVCVCLCVSVRLRICSSVCAHLKTITVSIMAIVCWLQFVYIVAHMRMCATSSVWFLHQRTTHDDDRLRTTAQVRSSRAPAAYPHHTTRFAPRASPRRMRSASSLVVCQAADKCMCTKSACVHS